MSQPAQFDKVYIPFWQNLISHHIGIVKHLQIRPPAAALASSAFTEGGSVMATSSVSAAWPLHSWAFIEQAPRQSWEGSSLIAT